MMIFSVDQFSTHPSAVDWHWPWLVLRRKPLHRMLRRLRPLPASPVRPLVKGLLFLHTAHITITMVLEHRTHNRLYLRLLVMKVSRLHRPGRRLSRTLIALPEPCEKPIAYETWGHLLTQTLHLSLPRQQHLCQPASDPLRSWPPMAALAVDLQFAINIPPLPRQTI